MKPEIYSTKINIPNTILIEKYFPLVLYTDSVLHTKFSL